MAQRTRRCLCRVLRNIHVPLLRVWVRQILSSTRKHRLSPIQSRQSRTLNSSLISNYRGTQVANTAAVFSDRATAGQDNGTDGITQAPNTSVLLYISLIFGFSLMVSVWVFFRVSGGLFNPAVSPPSLRPNCCASPGPHCQNRESSRHDWAGAKSTCKQSDMIEEHHQDQI